MPFSLLVKRLLGTRDASRSPFTDVAFVLKSAQDAQSEFNASGSNNMPLFFMSADGVPLNLGGGDRNGDRNPAMELNLESFAVPVQHEQFDIKLVMARSPQDESPQHEHAGSRPQGRSSPSRGLHALLSYNADLYDELTMHRLSEHFNVLLKAAVSDTKCRLHDLTLTSASELRLVTHVWNHNPMHFPSNNCVHELVEAQVKRTPHLVALDFAGEDPVTYDQLNRRANQLAAHLRSLGLTRDMAVPVLISRRVDLVVALLAVLKAGGACLPVDPKCSKERVSLMLADANTHLALTELALKDKLSVFSDVSLVVVDDLQCKEIVSALDSNNLACVNSPRDLFYIIYTSGSSGTPKGACADILIW